MSKAVPIKAKIAKTYNLLITKTKNKIDGILPISVRTLGSVFLNGIIKELRYLSIDNFFTLSMIKIDLHTHSIISPDGAGSITASDFEYFLREGVLDCIAITDHNETRFAQMMNKKFGEKIIIGEEIKTKDGEIIGLFLKKTIPPDLSAKQAIRAIREQDGLVYIPHPFETIRKGLQRQVLEAIVEDIDIFETFNGRGRFHGKTKESERFAKAYNLVAAASSDAHGYHGIGKTFTTIKNIPNKSTLKKLLLEGSPQKIYAPLMSYLYPITNMIKNKLISKK